MDMPKKIAVIDGHPDPKPERFCHALAQAYADGAKASGYEVNVVALSTLEFALLQSATDWESGSVPLSLSEAQGTIGRADHLVFIYPLWLGGMPALLKGFLEQVFRPGFAIKSGARTMRLGLLKGKSARIVITMGMPALVYRWYFGAHSLKSLERNILRFAGIGPIRESLIGDVAASDTAARENWLIRMHQLGRDGQ
jgi:putative NADPH-quinone reductase